MENVVRVRIGRLKSGFPGVQLTSEFRHLLRRHGLCLAGNLGSFSDFNTKGSRLMFKAVHTIIPFHVPTNEAADMLTLTLDFLSNSSNDAL